MKQIKTKNGVRIVSIVLCILGFAAAGVFIYLLKKKGSRANEESSEYVQVNTH